MCGNKGLAEKKKNVKRTCTAWGIGPILRHKKLNSSGWAAPRQGEQMSCERNDGTSLTWPGEWVAGREGGWVEAARGTRLVIYCRSLVAQNSRRALTQHHETVSLCNNSKAAKKLRKNSVFAFTQHYLLCLLSTCHFISLKSNYNVNINLLLDFNST